MSINLTSFWNHNKNVFSTLLGGFLSTLESAIAPEHQSNVAAAVMGVQAAINGVTAVVENVPAAAHDVDISDVVRQTVAQVVPVLVAQELANWAAHQAPAATVSPVVVTAPVPAPETVTAPSAPQVMPEEKPFDSELPSPADVVTHLTTPPTDTTQISLTDIGKSADLSAQA